MSRSDWSWVHSPMCVSEQYLLCPCNIQKFLSVKIENFHCIFLYFSYFCSKHRLWVHIRTASPRRLLYDTLELPRRGGSKECPQSMFWSKNKKNWFTPAYPTFAMWGLRGCTFHGHVFQFLFLFFKGTPAMIAQLSATERSVRDAFTSVCVRTMPHVILLMDIALVNLGSMVFSKYFITTTYGLDLASLDELGDLGFCDLEVAASVFGTLGLV